MNIDFSFFAGYEGFYLRSGWLSKGIEDERPKYGKYGNAKNVAKKNLKVVYTKHEKNGIYRRRQCSCGNTFETFEKFV
ncbi:hypothetical protein AAEX28_01570 [Lentisphaerota bacterium WC36G]|nr:DUF4007 family protein [Lentisphaerae bacterium WC36]